MANVQDSVSKAIRELERALDLARAQEDEIARNFKIARSERERLENLIVALRSNNTTQATKVAQGSKRGRRGGTRQSIVIDAVIKALSEKDGQTATELAKIPEIASCFPGAETQSEITGLISTYLWRENKNTLSGKVHKKDDGRHYLGKAGKSK